MFIEVWHSRMMKSWTLQASYTTHWVSGLWILTGQKKSIRALAQVFLVGSTILPGTKPRCVYSKKDIEILKDTLNGNIHCVFRQTAPWKSESLVQLVHLKDMKTASEMIRNLSKIIQQVMNYLLNSLCLSAHVRREGNTPVKNLKESMRGKSQSGKRQPHNGSKRR